MRIITASIQHNPNIFLHAGYLSAARSNNSFMACIFLMIFMGYLFIKRRKVHKSLSNVEKGVALFLFIIMGFIFYDLFFGIPFF